MFVGQFLTYIVYCVCILDLLFLHTKVSIALILCYKQTVLVLSWLDVFSKEEESKHSATALVNVQLRNSMALLRRCCNHPYLIEYPMDNGQFRIDESLVTACGKLKLLDRMLTELKRNGHKVLCAVLCSGVL